MAMVKAETGAMLAGTVLKCRNHDLFQVELKPQCNFGSIQPSCKIEAANPKEQSSCKNNMWSSYHR
jgi:hypothetical protein